MPFHRFDPDSYYRTHDPALGVIATRGTLAQWRYQGTGPRYVRFGHRVLYHGAELNAWLDARVVETDGRRPGGGRPAGIGPPAPGSATSGGSYPMSPTPTSA